MTKFDPTKDYRDAINGLTPTQDIFGQQIRVGSLVRVFEPDLDDNGTIMGFEQEGDRRPDGRLARVRFTDGVIEATGGVFVQGAERYTLRVVREVSGSSQTVHTDNAGLLVYVPVNGLPATMNGRTFGVVVIDSPEIDPNRDYREDNAKLTHDRDLFGREIRVGSLVRSFDFPYMFEKDGHVTGLDLTGERVCYTDGVVEAMGEDQHPDGGRAYRIRVARKVIAKDAALPFIRLNRAGDAIFTPLNGTEILGRSYNCFGVVVL